MHQQYSTNFKEKLKNVLPKFSNKFRNVSYLVKTSRTRFCTSSNSNFTNKYSKTHNNILKYILHKFEPKCFSLKLYLHSKSVSVMAKECTTKMKGYLP